MKTCPTCNSTYNDDTLSFCLNDGTVLVNSGNDPEATQRIPASQNTQPYGSFPQPGPYVQPPPFASSTTQPQYGTWTEPQQKQGSGRLWLAIVGIAAILLLVGGVGFAIVLTQTDWLGGTSSNNRNSNNRNGNRSGTTPTPTPEPPAAEKLGLVGRWKGTQNDGASSLVIVSGEGNTFSGTKFQGENEVTFTGTIDPTTRRITINETKLVKGTPYSNGKGWSLATETGVLSADGRKISGKGIDEYNRKTPYSWSYTKQ